MPTIQVRYPGRVCVLGEHCDWAGGASLTVPLPLGIRINAEPARSTVTARSCLEGVLLEGSWDPSAPQVGPGQLRFVPAAIRTLIDAGIQVRPTELWIDSNLPPGRGFSSSAALSLGLLDALSRSAGHPQTIAKLTALAYRLEHAVLGISCGRLDPAACAAAQPLFFRWKPDPCGAMTMTTRRVSPLAPLHFVIGAFDRPRDTQAILATLSKHHQGPLSDPDANAVREAIAEFGCTAEAGVLAIQRADHRALGAAMNRSQHIYEENLASRFTPTRAPALIQAVSQLRQLGALGAKFSGAGGDGSILALFEREDQATSAAKALEIRGVQAWYVFTGVP